LRCARPSGGFVRWVYEPTRLACVDGTAPDTFDDGKNAVLLDFTASSPYFTTEERQDRRENGGRERLEQFSDCSALRALRADAARAPHSGSLHRFNDVVEKLRNFEHESKKVRFFEIRSDSISAFDTLRQGVNEPEGRPRSIWNEIAIPVANSGFPSVSR
jgi:hypothetical protein